MQLSTPGPAPYAVEKASESGMVCEVRTDFLDRLAGVIASLGRAKLELMTASEIGNDLDFEVARFEIENLRARCDLIRADLERHRADHGC